MIATTFPAGASPSTYTQRGVTGRDLVSITDFLPDELACSLELAAAMKARPADFRGTLAGKQIVLFFEKPSLRTRLTFEAGMNSLGGTSFFVDQTASRLGAREPLSDIAHNLERWVDGVVLRTFAHETVTSMAMHASIPVINALSELEHPCQAMADMLTLQEHFGDAEGCCISPTSATATMSRIRCCWQRRASERRSRWEHRRATSLAPRSWSRRKNWRS